MKQIRSSRNLLAFMLMAGIFFSCEGVENPSAGNPGNPDGNRPPGWQPIFLASNEDLHDLIFINDQAGWIVGENRTLFSTSAGDVGWSQAPVELPLENLTSVFFINEQMGWIAGNYSLDQPMGQIGFSGIGGGYPVQLEVFEEPLNALHFIDQNNGWIGGENGFLAKTENGGYKWEVFLPFTEETIYDFVFMDRNTGWIVTSNGGIFHTGDGTVWNRELTNTEADIHSIFMLDEENLWACGSSNIIFKRNAGQEDSGTWKQFRIEGEFANMIWNDIFFTDQSTGWIVGNYGTVYKTSDGGMTWDRQSSGVLSHLNAIYMVNGNRGWAVGEQGTIISYVAE